MADATPPETLTPRQLAERLGYKPHYGNQLAKEGRFVFAPDGKHVLVAESIARFQASKDPSKQGVADRHAATRAQAAEPAVADTDADAGDTPDDIPGFNYQASKAKREHYAAERELTAHRKEARELIEASEHTAVFAQAGARLRAGLEAWASILPPQLVGRDEVSIRATIADQVEQLLRELTTQISAAASAHKDQKGQA